MPHLTIDNRQIYYEWATEADLSRETVVFLHDGLGATGAWKNIPEKLAHENGMNALVYDRWGYGQSDSRTDFNFGFMEDEVPILCEILDRLELPRVHLVGHSDGGSIALVLAGKIPERAISVVTEAAHTFVEPETLGGIRNLLAQHAAGELPNWLKRLHGKRAEELLLAWGHAWLEEPFSKWQIEDWLGYITCPVLAIQGEDDEFGTAAQIQSIVNRVGKSKSWMVPNCGHSPHAQAEDAFIAKVGAFLRTHSEKL